MTTNQQSGPYYADVFAQTQQERQDELNRLAERAVECCLKFYEAVENGDDSDFTTYRNEAFKIGKAAKRFQGIYREPWEPERSSLSIPGDL